MSDDIDLTGYFERVGFSGSIAPTLETLATLVGLHTAAIPFENLGPLLGEPVRLERGNLQQKLIYEKRGGYCLEQNLLFDWALETLGYEGITVLAARVLMGAAEDDRAVPLTHILLAVPVGASTYIADVGFGGNTPTAPLRLRADAEQQTPHETYRLTGGDPTWLLEIRIGDDWQVLYAFEMEPRGPEEFTAINDRVSGVGNFKDNLTVARALKGRRIGLRNLTLRTHVLGGETETTQLATAQEIKDALTGIFGLPLPPAEKLDPALKAIIARELALPGPA